MSRSAIKARIRELRKVSKDCEKANAIMSYSEVQRELWGLRMALKGKVRAL